MHSRCQGFEGGRTIRMPNGTTYLFTAEFKGWPVNANMRLGLWRTDANVTIVDSWRRVGTVAGAESQGNDTSLASWNKTCSRTNLNASPWAPMPIFDDIENRWHVHWVSYACDLSWVVSEQQSRVITVVFFQVDYYQTQLACPIEKSNNFTSVSKL